MPDKARWLEPFLVLPFPTRSTPSLPSSCQSAQYKTPETTRNEPQMYFIFPSRDPSPPRGNGKVAHQLPQKLTARPSRTTPDTAPRLHRPNTQGQLQLSNISSALCFDQSAIKSSCQDCILAVDFLYKPISGSFGSKFKFRKRCNI